MQDREANQHSERAEVESARSLLDKLFKVSEVKFDAQQAAALNYYCPWEAALLTVVECVGRGGRRSHHRGQLLLSG